jgi:hypothetical protein
MRWKATAARPESEQERERRWSASQRECLGTELLTKTSDHVRVGPEKETSLSDAVKEEHGEL